MPDIPTYVYPFLFALAALAAGRLFGGSAREEPESLPRFILYAIALACLLLGLFLMGLGGAPSF